MKISLLGYMGSGKSTIGKLLSLHNQMKFIDLDEYIENKAEMKIPQIFQDKGEIYFRKFEKECLCEILDEQNFILATGGGTPAYYNNLEILLDSTLCFYLQASPNLLSERLIHQKFKRPMIAHIENKDLTEFIAKHLFERNDFYQKAHHIISIQGKSEQEIVLEIDNLIKTHQSQS